MSFQEKPLVDATCGIYGAKIDAKGVTGYLVVLIEDRRSVCSD